jgi:thioredoxin-dependent peroxiredoxin
MPPADPGKLMARAPATDLRLRDQHGQERRLSDFHGRNVVVYFYPKDDTPGCAIEGREFRDLLERFKAFNTEVVGVSTDSIEQHQAFASKHAFPFLLLSDEDGEMARAFGVLHEGRAARSTFVLDHDLRVRRAFHEVTPRGHARQVLDFIRSLTEAHRMLGG